MSDAYHRPTHTFAKNDDELNIFNTTQVRLYGIHKVLDWGAENVADFGQFTLSIKGDPKSAAENSKKKHEGAPERGLSFFAIDVKNAGRVMLLALPKSGTRQGEPAKLTAGVIYGYAYEGHCYDLPKPKIMLIPANPEMPQCDDCGYDCKKDCHYRVWVVDKLDECVEIEVSQGFVEQLVLEANMPGKRSPTTYRATMQMVHRSGRLTE